MLPFSRMKIFSKVCLKSGLKVCVAGRPGQVDEHSVILSKGSEVW
jgi:hypothetical protein